MARFDLNGELLTVATNLSPPYVFMNYSSDYSKWNLTSGVEVKLLEALRAHFNFTYEVLNCDNDWGVLHSNNSWTGIIGAIVSKKADIGFGGLTITEERSRYVYFTEPHIITSVSYITPPPKNRAKVTLVLEPFDVLVWVCIIVSLIVMLFIEVLIVNKWIEYRNMDIKWGIISVLLKQNFCCRPPKIIHLRLLLYFWLLACLVLTSSYSGCLYSLMAVPSKIMPIDELNDLATEQRNGRIQVTAIGGSSYYESLKSANFGVYREIGKYLLPVNGKEEGLNVVIKGEKPTAYISTRDHLVYGFLRFGSKLIYLPPPTQESTLFVDLMGIAIQNDFEYKKSFNNV